MRDCCYCKQKLNNRQKKFCSVKCNGLFKRGRAREYFANAAAFARAQNHIRILIETPDGKKRVYLHRHLVETHIRPLNKGEIVHHKDENKHNNSLDNLEILSGQAAHLHKHNYWRNRPVKTETADDWQDFGW